MNMRFSINSLVVLLIPLAVAVAAAVPSAFAAGAPAELRATYTLPVPSGAQYAACSATADSAHAVVGIPWGGRSPLGPPNDSMCRGFRLVTLRSGSSRTIVLLPMTEKPGLWAVDEPVLLGG